MGKTEERKTDNPKTETLSMPTPNSMVLGSFVCDLRRSLKIRQADLAQRAGVSRQWIVALEQGKPTLEVGLVLRTLETLGLDVTLTPVDPPPAWMLKLSRAAQAKQAAVAARRRAKRRTRREAERLNRLALNAVGSVGWD
ncbi:helix-turn-helix domain-containing protein [Beijerinckia sp. L45]|uniref:helix-turn-helix domain-containing protein n=1 Tax=Beijerinckia sp. L45 TaxID=1641855 RepID=UPI00131E2849|nr:helix-turn-helix domain-containing protein [Beijerinckia sp. L45]